MAPASRTFGITLKQLKIPCSGSFSSHQSCRGCIHRKPDSSGNDTEHRKREGQNWTNTVGSVIAIRASTISIEFYILMTMATRCSAGWGDGTMTVRLDGALWLFLYSGIYQMKCVALDCEFMMVCMMGWPRWVALLLYPAVDWFNMCFSIIEIAFVFSQS